MVVRTERAYEGSESSDPPVTPNPGPKKKKKSSSIFTNKFSKAMLEAMEKPDDEGWRQVQAKPKAKPKRSSRSKAKQLKQQKKYSQMYDNEDEESVVSRPPPPQREPSFRPEPAILQEEVFQKQEEEMMAKAEAHTQDFYSDDEMKELVLQLGLAKNWEEAFKAAQMIRVILKVGSQEKKADAAHKLYHLQVLPAVVLKLQSFGHALDQLAEFAIRILVQLTYFEPSAKQDIVMMGAMQIVHDVAAKNFPGDLYVSGNVAILLSNIALEEDLQEHVSAPEFRAFVLKHMQDFPQEPYTQRVCSKYLYNVASHADKDNNDHNGSMSKFHESAPF